MPKLPAADAALLAPLSAALRRRELAGDARAGMWARGVARRAQRRYLRAHWAWLSAGALLMLAPLLLADLLVRGNFARGFLLGAGLTGTAAFLAYWVLQVTGTGPTMMGDLAEQLTAAELRGLRRDGWRVVNHVCLRRWDIDHVLIGPAGVYAVETKWSARPWVLDPPDDRLRAAADRAGGNARDLRLWADFRRAGVREVQPVVLLWGAGIAELGEHAVEVRGVQVMPGPAFRRRCAPAGVVPVLTDGQVLDAWAALDRQARRRDARESEPVPASLLQLGARVLLPVLAGLVGFLAAARLLPLIGSLWWWSAVCLVLLLAGLPLRRWELSRLPALGWMSGLGGALLMAVLDALLFAVQ